MVKRNKTWEAGLDSSHSDQVFGLMGSIEGAMDCPSFHHESYRGLWVYEFWENYNDLTATEISGIMVNKRNHPQMAQQFRLVKYYNLPRWVVWELYGNYMGYGYGSLIDFWMRHADRCLFKRDRLSKIGELIWIVSFPARSSLSNSVCS